MMLQNKGQTSFLLSLLFESCVVLYSPQKVVSALGVLDMLNSKVNSLFKISVTDNLVYDHTHGARGDVVDDPSSTVHQKSDRSDRGARKMKYTS